MCHAVIDSSLPLGYSVVVIRRDCPPPLHPPHTTFPFSSFGFFFSFIYFFFSISPPFFHSFPLPLRRKTKEGESTKPKLFSCAFTSRTLGPQRHFIKLSDFFSAFFYFTSFFFFFLLVKIFFKCLPHSADWPLLSFFRFSCFLAATTSIDQFWQLEFFFVPFRPIILQLLKKFFLSLDFESRFWNNFLSHIIRRWTSKEMRENLQHGLILWQLRTATCCP